MIRVVAAVVLAAALLAASLPAVADARVDRSAARADLAAGRLEAAARSLLADDDPVAGGDGARRVVRVRLPTRSLTSARVDRFAIACARACAVTYRVAGGPVHRHLLEGLPLATPSGGIALVEPGSHRLVLGLRRGPNGGPVVTVERE